jgi:hypothetical protein
VTQGVLAVVQLLALAAAMIGDVQRPTERHWSHWLAACARVLMTAGVLVYYTWQAWFSEMAGR